MKVFNYYILIFFSFCIVYSQSSQRDYNEELRYQNDAINKMKKEIEELSSKLRKANINETTTSKRITNLDEEIALVNKLIQSLKKEETSNRNQVNTLKDRISKVKEYDTELKTFAKANKTPKKRARTVDSDLQDFLE